MKTKEFPSTKRTYMKLQHLLQTNTGKLFLLTGFTFPLLNNLQLALLIFIGTYIADFATGILASYVEIKNGTKPMPKSGRVFSSEEARKTVVKGVGYALFILCAYGLEVVFFDKDVKLGQLSTKSFGLCELAIGFSTVIEMYSVLIENLKRAGWDIIGQVKGISTALSTTYNKLKSQWVK